MNLKTTNPQAPNVAAEYGASCHQDEQGVYHIGNGVSQQDFDDALADLAGQPLKRTSQAAYDKLQSEGHGRDFT